MKDKLKSGNSGIACAAVEPPHPPNLFLPNQCRVTRCEHGLNFTGI